MNKLASDFRSFMSAKQFTQSALGLVDNFALRMPHRLAPEARVIILLFDVGAEN
jgi:hypothetical protein